MILATDVHYAGPDARAAGITFDAWEAAEPARCFVSRTAIPADYQPGHFYQRELPCILNLLREYSLQPDCILIDGYVFLDGYVRPGLGKRLFDALQGKTKVIGVAKTPFTGIGDEFQVFRGDSRRPLYVTCIGIPLEIARTAVAAMHGRHRIPTLLRMVDRMSRTAEKSEQR